MQEFNFKNLNLIKPSSYKSAGSARNYEKDVTPLLFTPIVLGNGKLELRNRIVVAPMCQYSAINGFANEYHLIHYGGLIKGGASLVIIESTAVQPEGRITYGDLGIWSDNHIEGFKKITKFAHQYDTKIAIQIGHAGRKASTSIPFSENGGHTSIPSDDQFNRGWDTYSSSPIQWSDKMKKPIEMSINDIEETIESFKLAAIRADKAGFDAIELHFAHGYLVSQFLSPTSNKRNDSYGGSFEGRTKIVFDIINSVKSVWPSNKSILLRLSAEEWVGNDGWTIEDSIKLSNQLQNTGVIDLLDCSSGGNNSLQKITPGPGYQVQFSDKIKNQLPSPKPNQSKMLISTVGSITTANQAEQILQNNQADLILFGRPFLRNPNFTYELASQLNCKIDYSLQYQQANRL